MAQSAGVGPGQGELYCMDCLVGLSRIDPGSVRLAFADPPFNIGYAYDVYRDRKARGEYLDWSRRWMRAVVDAMSPDATFWLAIGDEYAAELKLVATDELGLTCRSWVIWYYTFGVHCTKKFTRSHAHLFHFVKDPQRFTFNGSAIRVPSARQLVYADSRANPDGRVPDDTWILRPQDVPRGFQPEHDTWYYPRVCGTFRQRAAWHGCQMPERILERIICVSSNPGDLVLDPFAGSGTTLAVAKKLHRQWIGFELSRTYAKRAQRRLERIKPGDPIEGPENPLATAPPTAAGRRLGHQAPRRSPRLSGARTSPLIARVNVSLGQVAAANGELLTAITQAYLAASDGYAIDRVLADPRLNAEFHKACDDLGIPGSPSDWNRRLLALRKAGRLRSLPQPQRTVIPREELDQFTFASEIAWQIVSEQNAGMSLDDILCEPPLVAQFDRTAARFAPGWTPFHYRWGALSWRKAAGRRRSSSVPAPTADIKRELARQTFAPGDLSRIPTDPGVYLVRAGRISLYVGDTLLLPRRIERHIQHGTDLLRALGQNKLKPDCLRFATLPDPQGNEDYRWSVRSTLLADLCPLGNQPKPRKR